MSTKRFNEQVKRNLERFPSDFMLQLDEEEFTALRSQFAALKTGRREHRPSNKQQPLSHPAPGNVPDRFLTVADIAEPKPNKTAIRLRGKWLQQAGFLAQTRVRVRVMPGCLVIIVQDQSRTFFL